MPKSQIKGSFIKKGLEYISRKQGKDALKYFPKPPEFYQDEHWYPFEDFYQVMKKTEELFSGDNKDILFLMGRSNIKKDTRWATMFKGRDPMDVFGVNTRQDDQVRIGDFTIVEKGPKHLSIKMRLWSDNLEYTRTWARYYVGCSQTILDLTGFKGSVSTRPEPEDLTTVFFEFRWD